MFNLCKSAFARMLQRCDAILVGKVDICPVIDEQLYNLLVCLVTIAKQNGLQQGCPAKVVDVVHIDIGACEQFPNYLYMSSFRSRDNRNPTKTVRQSGISVRLNCESENIEPALRACVQ